MKTFGILSVALAVLIFGTLQVAGMDDKKEKPMNDSSMNTRDAVFAGGCFWCTESDFEKVPGVVEAISGYTGGHQANPTYKQVSGGGTGHVEAIKVIYDPSRITYEQLLDVFWRHVDPTDGGGQFVDRGSQYRPVIFYGDDTERSQAEASRDRLAATGRFDRAISTDILPLGEFYPAEDYHQDYYKKNPIRYNIYRSGSGRDRFLEKAWKEPAKGTGKSDTGAKVMEKTAATAYTRPDDGELKKRLSPLQYAVVRMDRTEPPFKNEFWDNHDEGIYVDIASGEPLFSSTDKFESGTGWPSFTRPLEPDHVVEKSDNSLFMVRTEVRSKYGDSHLGHLFTDGPAPTGLRYCINSAALRFIPRSEMEKEGYGQFQHVFE